MKTLQICTAEGNIAITMPSFLFWLFRRFAKVKTSPAEPINGQTLDYIVYDEAMKEKE